MRSTASLLALTAIASVSANYNQDIAFRAMYYSAATYCNKGTVDSWTCGEPCSSLSGFGEMTRIENELLDTFGVVGYNQPSNEIVIAFRGTNGADFMNWMTNLIYYRVQYADVANTQVHSGFYTAYSSVSYTLLKAVRALLAKYPSASILITGHSLGGALATFAALDMKREIKTSNNINFYTFGSPRIGNQAFTDYVMKLYPGQYQRVTHYTDVVVQVPPRQMGFNHAGNEVWYYNNNFDGKMQVCENNPGSDESKKCADSYYLTTGIDAHLHYLGKAISGMCTIKGVREDDKLARDTFDRFHTANSTA
jgi:hypothetical protein